MGPLALLTKILGSVVLVLVQWLPTTVAWTPDLTVGDRVEIASDQVYFGIGQYQLYKSVDSGKTWTSVLDAPPRKASNSDPPTLSDKLFAGRQEPLQDLWFIDRQTGWVLGYDWLQHTSDGGTTWTPVGLPHAFITSCCFESVKHGWCAGFEDIPGRRDASRDWGDSHPVIYETKDGGENWRRVFVGPGGKYYFGDIRLVGRRTLFAASDTIAMSFNAGRTWSTLDPYRLSRRGQNPLALPYEIVFVNATRGYIFCNNGDWYLKTTDGGKSWQLDNKPVAPYGRWSSTMPSNKRVQRSARSGD